MKKWLFSFSLEKRSIDYILCGIIIALLVIGLFVFFSASLQSLGDSKWNMLMTRQLIFSLFIGGGLLFLFSHVSYRELAPWSIGLLIFSLLLAVLVFIPGLGMTHGGGRRWLDLRITNIQPGELVKFSGIIFFAAWCAKWRKKMFDWKYGIMPLFALLALLSIIFYFQKDIGTLLIASSSLFVIFLASAAPWKHIFLISLAGLIALSAAIVFIPHVNDRVMTYIDFKDPQGSGWQVKQSLIAVGSGGIWGKGYLKSVQRFSYLPEAHGDSIFAVAAEELGFIGASILVLLYVGLALRGIKIAGRAQDEFGTLLVVGFTVMIIIQAFLNMGSVIDLIPFTGEPLPLVSQGGTALVIALSSLGIMLNVSRYQKSI